MTKATAERRSYTIHNTKALLLVTKLHNKQQSDPDDAEAIKFHKDICEVIDKLSAIECDLDEIIDFEQKRVKKGKK